MDDKEFEKILKEGKLQLEHDYEEFLSDVRTRTSDASKFITLSELENKLSVLNSKTHKTYSDATEKLINSLDEKELVKTKKENTKKRG